MSDDPELDARLASYQAKGAGVSDLNTITSVWSSVLDEDYVVQKRKQSAKVASTVRTKTPTTAFSTANAAERRRDFNDLSAVPAGPVSKQETTKELLQGLFAKSRDDPSGASLTGLQQQLFAGGFYQKSAGMDDIEFGTLDELTVDAYYTLMQWTARYNASGADLTVDDVLAERSAKMIGPLREKLAKQKSQAGRTISLADPTGLAQAINQVSTDTVGRKATPDEQRMFVAMFHALQSGAQSVEGGTAVNPDVSGQAEAFMRQQAPTEAAGHDMASTFNSFLSIIGGMGTT